MRHREYEQRICDRRRLRACGREQLARLKQHEVAISSERHHSEPNGQLVGFGRGPKPYRWSSRWAVGRMRRGPKQNPARGGDEPFTTAAPYTPPGRARAPSALTLTLPRPVLPPVM